MASLRIGMTTLDRLGFSAARGIERHLSARLGSRRTEGLETTAESLGILDALSPTEQDQLVATAIRDARTAPTRITQLAQAWHEGDAPKLDALLREGFKEFPQIRKRLIDDRNAAWLPKIRSLLKGSENAIVIVGSGHLAGPDSLVDLLAKEGVSLTQQDHTTRRHGRLFLHLQQDARDRRRRPGGFSKLLRVILIESHKNRSLKGVETVSKRGLVTKITASSMQEIKDDNKTS
jgi:hypothetical protein